MEKWQIVCAVLFLSVVLINRKTRLLRVVKGQFKIYKNDINDKYYWLDILTFIIVPIAIAVIASKELPYDKIANHAGTIITVFSLVATLPLSFLALLIDKVLEHQKEKEVAKETFVSITIDVIYSLIIIALVIMIAITEVKNTPAKVLVGLVVFFIIKVVLNILMILKRVFAIFEK